MELKRIIARDSRSANEKAIQLYGPDVLIISSQRVDQQTELIVAVDVGSEAGASDAMGHQAQPVANVDKDSENLSFKADKDQSLPFAEVFQNANVQTAVVREQESVSSEDFQTAQAGLLARGVVAEQAVQGHGAAPESAFVQAAQMAQYEQHRSQEIVAMLREEMSALRREFALSRQMQPWQQTLGLSPDIQKLTMAMQEVGMPVALRSLLTDSIQGLQTLGEAWPVVQSLLADAISRPAVRIPDAGMHALCGPSGAGKSSMLGRLALAAAQTHGAEKQVMISYGDQRPGAWSQLQLLASQAGASCFRATDLGMLQTLLDDLHGKTVWIDTPGTDFSAHAQQLMQSFSGLGIHAVLPVDATVTSVQKTLQNSDIRWASLMLTKVDEAAYPWPLIKGLCDQTLSVSCMAEDSRIHVAPLAFGVERLVGLAMTPLQALLPEIQHLPVATKPAKAVRKPRVKKVVDMAFEVQPKPRAVKPRAVTAKSSAKAAHG
jgi:flagellar biosynthesis protein FlhF